MSTSKATWSPLRASAIETITGYDAPPA